MPNEFKRIGAAVNGLSQTNAPMQAHYVREIVSALSSAEDRIKSLEDRLAGLEQGRIPTP